MNDLTPLNIGIIVATFITGGGLAALLAQPFKQVQELLNAERENLDRILRGHELDRKQWNDDRAELKRVVKEIASSRDDIAESYRSLILQLGKQQAAWISAIGRIEVLISKHEYDKAIELLNNLQASIGAVDLQQMLMIESLISGTSTLDEATQYD